MTISAKAGISIKREMKYWYVYIMANRPNGVIYIGITDNLNERVKEHKLRVYPK